MVPVSPGTTNNALYLLLSFPQQVLVFILLAVQLVTIPGTSAARQDKNLTATILPEPKEDNTSRLKNSNVQRLQCLRKLYRNSLGY